MTKAQREAARREINGQNMYPETTDTERLKHAQVLALQLEDRLKKQAEEFQRERESLNRRLDLAQQELSITKRLHMEILKELIPS